MFKYIDIFAATNVKATHICSVKNINVFAIFQDRNFNVMLANELTLKSSLYFTQNWKKNKDIFLHVNPFTPKLLTLTLPSLKLDTSTVANGGSL